jgi:hypothetical protein
MLPWYLMVTCVSDQASTQCHIRFDHTRAYQRYPRVRKQTDIGATSWRADGRRDAYGTEIRLREGSSNNLSAAYAPRSKVQVSRERRLTSCAGGLLALPTSKLEKL